jgi:uncharacterized protein with ParB-like and HNH nuclease domain
MSNLSADLYNIKSIFQNPNSVVFNIPSFQRRFVWNKQNVKDMFDDFAEDSNNYSFKHLSDLDGYLLGSIVLIQSEDNTYYNVVDGQQRLTTLTLIFKSMANRFQELLNADPTNELYQALCTGMKSFYYADLRKKKLKISQDENLSYTKLYSMIINNVGINRDDFNDSNILEVWDEINYQISDFDNDMLIKFSDYLQDRVMLIKIVCPNEDRAFQLFEVLNNRGQSLEALDLIKNMMLQKIDNRDDLNKFNASWKIFSENMYIKRGKTGTVKNHSSSFLQYFIMNRYHEKIQKNKLVSFFKKAFKHLSYGSSDIVDIVVRLANYSVVYKSMIENSKNNDFSDSVLMYCLSLMDIKQFHQLLMLFYCDDYHVGEEYLQNIREKVLLGCIKMGMVTIYNHDSPNEIEKVMPRLIKSFYSDFYLTHNLSSSANSMLECMQAYDDERLTSIKSTFPYYKLSHKKAFNILKIIEILLNKNQGIMAKQAKGQTITVEHILPQKQPNDVESLGFDKSDDYQTLINTIGNLTLLRKDDNTHLKNREFSVKKKTYRQVDILITKALVGSFNSVSQTGANAERIHNLSKKYERSYYNDNWTKQTIEKRGRELTNLIIDFISGIFIID